MLLIIEKPSLSERFSGADDEIRTRDLILTKDVRYHLCHISKINGRTVY